MPTRRTFLKSTTLAASTLAFPRILTASKSGLDPIILGDNDHRYEVQHDWALLPENQAFGNTHGVCEDAAGNIYIKHTVHASSSKPDAIAVFDNNGKFIRSWGAEYKGGAHGLHYSKEPAGEFLYLCDHARGVVDKTTLTGEKVWSKTAPMESGVYNNPAEFHPTNIAVVPQGSGDRAGHFFIADGYGKSWIHRYNAKGDYLGTFGGVGKERGQMICPHGLMIDTRSGTPRLLVADRENHRLQYFDLDGHPQGFITEELRRPCHFHERNGVLLIPDLVARITLFDKNNKLITHLGDGQDMNLRDKPRDKFLPGKFIAPHSGIFDHQGNIFIVEWVEVGRVTKLRKV